MAEPVVGLILIVTSAFPSGKKQIAPLQNVTSFTASFLSMGIHGFTFTWKWGFRDSPSPGKWRNSPPVFGLNLKVFFHVRMESRRVFLDDMNLGGGNSKIFYVHRANPGEMIQFDDHIFQMG